MSIATQISALQTDKTNIASAITTKGGTVNSGDGFDNFAADIMTIPQGPIELDLIRRDAATGYYAEIHYFSSQVITSQVGSIPLGQTRWIEVQNYNSSDELYSPSETGTYRVNLPEEGYSRPAVSFTVQGNSVIDIIGQAGSGRTLSFILIDRIS